MVDLNEHKDQMGTENPFVERGVGGGGGGCLKVVSHSAQFHDSDMALHNSLL